MTKQWSALTDQMTEDDIRQLRSYLDTRLEELEEVEDPANPKGDWFFTVVVSGCTLPEANEVMCERLGYDDDYGFPYRIEYRQEDN